jgi:hypothetical protein
MYVLASFAKTSKKAAVWLNESPIKTPSKVSFNYIKHSSQLPTLNLSKQFFLEYLDN